MLGAGQSLIATMRLAQEHIAALKQASAELFGTDAVLRVFGSRLHDDARGGDLDLMVESHREVLRPAWHSALLAARASRVLQGRKVDVVLSAPNLRELPIHAHARREGQVL